MGLPQWAIRYAPPAIAFAALLAGWEAYVRLQAIPPYVLPSPTLIGATLIADRAILFPALADAQNNLRCARCGRLRRRWPCDSLHAMEMGRALALALCNHFASHSHRGDCALALDISRGANSGACLRLSRRVFPHFVEHRAWACLRGPQPHRSFPALRRRRLANASLSALARLASLFPRRPQNRWRPFAHRRYRRRARRGQCRQGRGSCVPHHRGRLPAQYTAHVRRARADRADRDCDLRALCGALLCSPAPLARERRPSLNATLSCPPFSCGLYLPHAVGCCRRAAEIKPIEPESG